MSVHHLGNVLNGVQIRKRVTCDQLSIFSNHRDT